ncbi:MAG TPA: hypothetical protein PLO62_11185, partial [Candidatus Hydrogenedentes bacterium]|nr:hypothetical protein [Candidatus Hydrogenedentota bacterium]HOS03579.1 hypothetical protein [Candidatus Hydrogenedentota bacterium]
RCLILQSSAESARLGTFGQRRTTSGFFAFMDFWGCLRITGRYGKLTPPDETEVGSAGEQPIAPTGTF